MRKFLIIAGGLTLLCLARANAQPAWVPAHFSIPPDTISPDGRYGVMLPDAETDGPNSLVDMRTGKLVADIAGEPGWRDPNRSMRWGEMEAKWSVDGSTFCWIHPDKWFPESYVVLHLHNGKRAWQVELMKPADREILARTEAAAPLNFAIAKLDNAGDGSAYPEGFSINVSEPADKFSLPLVCNVSLTSDPKEDEPVENGVQASLTITVDVDGGLAYSDFKVKPGPLSADAAERVKAQAVRVPLVDTHLGKVMLFPGLGSKDGRYELGWTIRPAKAGEPPVDWSHWDPTDPDKLLRQYDWQQYDRPHWGNKDKMSPLYEAADFVLDVHTGMTARLPTEYPNWPGKKDGWEMTANWYSGMDGRRYALIGSGQDNFDAGNFWLVFLNETPMRVKDLTTTMRQAVNGLLRDRRPEVAADDFFVCYPLKAGEEVVNSSDPVEIPFGANTGVSDQGEFQLSGSLAIRLADGAVTGAASGQQRLDPFVTNQALKEADETLNAVFQAAIKSLSSKDARALKQEERDWIVQRDKDADQAVNMVDYGSTQQAYEAAREKSLLESTNKRIDELKRQFR